jgi:hypothetical protein
MNSARNVSNRIQNDEPGGVFGPSESVQLLATDAKISKRYRKVVLPRGAPRKRKQILDEFLHHIVRCDFKERQRVEQSSKEEDITKNSNALVKSQC